MSVDLVIRVDTSEVERAGSTSAKSIGQAEDAAEAATASLAKMATAGGDAGDQVSVGAKRGAQSLTELVESLGGAAAAAERFGDAVDGSGGFSGRQIEVLERIRTPLREHKSDIEALNELNKRGAISVKEYEDELVSLEQRYGSSGRAESLLAQQLQQEVLTLQRIIGPLKSYEQEVETLDRLYKQAKISEEQYYGELDKLAKKAGVFQGPIQQQGKESQPAPPGGSSGSLGGILSSLPGGSAIGQIATGGVAAAAGVAALVAELKHISDEYTTLTNRVERFSTTSQSADDILHQQLDLSRELHSSLQETSELYVRVRESTNALNLSSREQQELAKDIGASVAAEGHSIGDAAALVHRLGVSFETGTVSGRELRSIIKEYPGIANELSEALGHSQSQLINLANKGQISAQTLIDAFRKVGPEAEKTLDRLNETFTQKTGHLLDSINVNVGHAIQAYFDSYESPAETAARNFARQQHEQQEVTRQLKTELEKNERTATIATAAQGIGIDIGPFSKAVADKLSEVRIAARAVGFDIGDSYVEAKAKAQLFGTEIDKIKEQHATQIIADDAKRLYDVLEGSNNIIEAQARAWAKLAEQAKIAAEAAAKFRANPPVNIPDAQRAQIQRELDLSARNAQTAQNDSQYGSSIVSYAQGVNNAREKLDELTRANKAGVIQGEAFRREYDSVLTTLNDGRLPEAIKFWEALHEPVAQSRRDFAALNALLASGKISASAFEIELSKVTSARIAFLEANNSSLTRKFPDLETDIAGLEKQLNPLGDNRAALDPIGDIEEKRAKQIQVAKEELGKILGPLRQYRVEIAALGELFEKGKLNSDQYALSIDRARAAYLAAEPATKTFGERVEEAWLKAKEAARQAGVDAKSYSRVLEEVNVAQIEARPGTRSTDDLVAIALLKDKQAAEEAGVAASSYAQVVDRVRAAQLAAGQEGKTFAGGLEAEWIKLRQDAEGFGASVAKLAIDDFGKLNDAIVTAANGGKVAWADFVDSAIQDLERLILKQLEVQAINGLIGLIGGGGGVASGISVVHPDLPIPVPDAISSAARSLPAVYPSIGDSSGVSTASSSLTQAQPIVQVHNHIDESAVNHALTSRSGQRAIANVIRRQPRGLKG